MNRYLLLSLLFWVFNFSLKAQERTLSSGGEASGSSGNVSYSIGLVDYSHMDGSQNSVTEGLQQPYELFSLGIENDPSTEFQVYPNPFQDLLIIKQTTLEGVDILGQIFDATGQLVWEGTLNHTNTTIDLKTLAPASYHLQLTPSGLTTRTYQLIKQ